MLALYCVEILTAEIMISCTVDFFGAKLVIGAINFATAAIIIDVINENYRLNNAKETTIIGVGVLIVYLAIQAISIFFDNGTSTWNLLQVRIVIVDIVVSYGVMQLINCFIYNKLKLQLHGKYLWIRAFFSTGATQLITALLFYELVYIDTYSQKQIFEIIVMSLVIKLLFAIIEIPIVYICKKTDLME